jgi:hypothetical protein
MREITPPHAKDSRTTRPRVLLCYYRAAMETREYALVRRLATDLETAGVEVASDEIQDVIAWSASQVFQADRWILLIQAREKESFTSLEEQLATASALQNQQPAPKVLRVLAATGLSLRIPPLANAIRTFDISVDYPRALVGLLLAINPDNGMSLYRAEQGTAPPPPNSRRIARRPFSIGFIVFIAFLLILIGVLITRSFIPVAVHQNVGSSSSPRISATVVKKTLPTPVSVATVNVPTPQSIYAQVTSQAPVISDGLQKEDGNHWDVSTMQGKTCAFIQKTYQVDIVVKPVAAVRHICLAESPMFSNLALQANINLLQGDVGGLVFRSDGHLAYYWFSLDSKGCYRLVLLEPDQQTRILSNDLISCLGLNMKKINQLTAIAQGSNIYLYVNGQFIKQFIDTTLTSGQIGFVGIERTHSTAIAFTNLRVWQL